MKKEKLLILSLILIFSLSVLTIFIINYEEEDDDWEGGVPNIQFIKENNRLSVLKINDNVDWSDITVSFQNGGNCTKPNDGKIKEGDAIINCTGLITIGYKPTNAILGSWEFD